MYICIHIHVYTKYMYVYICIYTCIYIYMYMYVYICTCIRMRGLPPAGRVGVGGPVSQLSHLSPGAKTLHPGPFFLIDCIK